MRKALAWVQANIRHFGGDPAKVTIFGWSAGAHIVDNLIATSPADPPFRAAIMESGEATYDGFFHPGDQVTARKAWDTLADKLGCSRKPDVLQCVRKADAFKIRDIIEREAVTFATAIDGVTQISDADAARAAGRVANVPLMLGNNAREGATATALGSNFSVAETVKAVFPNDTALQNEIIATYALGHEGRKTEADAVEQMFTDYFQTCVSLASCPAPQACKVPTCHSTTAHGRLPGHLLHCAPLRLRRLPDLALLSRRRLREFRALHPERRRVPRHAGRAGARHLPAHQRDRAGGCPERVHTGRVGRFRQEPAARARVERRGHVRRRRPWRAGQGWREWDHGRGSEGGGRSAVSAVV